MMPVNEISSREDFASFRCFLCLLCYIIIKKRRKNVEFHIIVDRYRQKHTGLRLLTDVFVNGKFFAALFIPLQWYYNK